MTLRTPLRLSFGTASQPSQSLRPSSRTHRSRPAMHRVATAQAMSIVLADRMVSQRLGACWKCNAVLFLASRWLKLRVTRFVLTSHICDTCLSVPEVTLVTPCNDGHYEVLSQQLTQEPASLQGLYITLGNEGQPAVPSERSLVRFLIRCQALPIVRHTTGTEQC